MIRLLIKGDATAAKVYAASRGIELDYGYEHETVGNRVEFVAECGDAHNGRVIKWFCENNGQHAPYPLGTLLHYTQNACPLERAPRMVVYHAGFAVCHPTRQSAEMWHNWQYNAGPELTSSVWMVPNSAGL